MLLGSLLGPAPKKETGGSVKNSQGPMFLGALPPELVRKTPASNETGNPKKRVTKDGMGRKIAEGPKVYLDYFVPPNSWYRPG